MNIIRCPDSPQGGAQKRKTAVFLVKAHFASVADPDISFGGGHEALRSSAAGARIEAPKAPKGDRV